MGSAKRGEEVFRYFSIYEVNREGSMGSAKRSEEIFL